MSLVIDLVGQLNCHVIGCKIRQNPHIQFIKEIEENGKIPFLDSLVSRDENKLRTTIYRKTDTH